MLRDEKIILEEGDRIEVRSSSSINGYTTVVIHDHRGLKEAVLTVLNPDHAEVLFASLGAHLRKPGFTRSGPPRDGFGLSAQGLTELSRVTDKIATARPPLALVGKPASEQDARLAIALVGGDDPEAA